LSAQDLTPVAPGVRQPRTLIKVGGVEMRAGFSWEIDSNTYYEADTFRCIVAVGLLPEGHGVDWWYGQDRLDIEIFAGFPSDPVNYTATDLESIFYGRIEDDEWDPAHGVIEISGRDLTSDLIDTKTSEAYPNLTASQIATKLASAHGLTPVVTATTTKAGRYYQIDTVRQQDERTEWDLLTWLAKEEGFVTYVRGKELHFEPAPSDQSQAYRFKYTPRTAENAPIFGGTTFKPRHNRALARDIKVTVKSWNPKTKKRVKRVAQMTRTRNRVLRSSGRPVTPVQEYSFTLPNLSPEQAQQLANKKLAELSRHEKAITIEGPADNVLQITHRIIIEGTGTPFDQVYYPDSIVRSMSAESGSGYHWSIMAKNHSPETEVTL